MKPAQFTNSMDASSFEYGQIWHECSKIYVQFHSKMLHDHESTNRNGSCVKKLENILREKFWRFFESTFEMNALAENSYDYPYIPLANDAENLF